jgi:hypothetical protein
MMCNKTSISFETAHASQKLDRKRKKESIVEENERKNNKKGS